MDLFASVSAAVLSVFGQATDLILSNLVCLRSQETSSDEDSCVLVHRTSAIR